MYRAHAQFRSGTHIPHTPILATSSIGGLAASAGIAQQAPVVAYQGLRPQSSANAPRARTTTLSSGGATSSNPFAVPLVTGASLPAPSSTSPSRRSRNTSSNSIPSQPANLSIPNAIELCVVLIPHVDPAHAPPSDLYPQQGRTQEGFKWDGAQFAALVEELLHFNLVFKVSLPSDGTVWQDFHDAVLTHLSRHALEIPGFGDHSQSPTGPHNVCFRLITTATKKRPNGRIYKAYDDLPASDWKASRFAETPFKTIRWPLDGEMSRLNVVVIDPSSSRSPSPFPLDGLSGVSSSLDTPGGVEADGGQSATSGRLQLRALPPSSTGPQEPAPQLARRSPSPEVARSPRPGGPSGSTLALFIPDSESESEPIPYMPSPSRWTPAADTVPEALPVQNPNPTPSDDQGLGLSSPTIPPTTAAASLMSDSAVPVSEASCSSASSSEPPTKQPRLRGPTAGAPPSGFDNVPDNIVPLVSKTENEVESWASSIRRSVRYDMHSNDVPSFNAPSIEVGAEVLYFLVYWNFDHIADDHCTQRVFEFKDVLDTRFNSPDEHDSPDRPRIKCNLVALETLIKLAQRFDLTIGGAIGRGVTRNLLREAIQVALRVPNLWQTRGRYSTIEFRPYAQERERGLHLRSCGFLCLLHMVALGAGPDPISPFLLRAAIEDEDVALQIDAALLRLLAPDDFATLIPWISHDKSVPVARNVTTRVASLLMASDINPAWVSNSPSILAQTEKHLFSQTMFGVRDLYHNLDFTAFTLGINYSTTLTHPANRLVTSFRGETRNYLAAMYNRRLSDVSVLLEHIDFRSNLDRAAISNAEQCSEAPTASNDAWDVVYEIMFEERLTAYLHGEGHPDTADMRNLMSPAEFDAARHDALLRGQYFLHAMTGSDLVPAATDWKIVIFFHHKGERVHFAPPENEPGPDPERIHIHACFGHADVHIDDGVRNLLVEPDASSELSEPPSNSVQTTPTHSSPAPLGSTILSPTSVPAHAPEIGGMIDGHNGIPSSPEAMSTFFDSMYASLGEGNLLANQDEVFRSSTHQYEPYGEAGLQEGGQMEGENSAAVGDSEAAPEQQPQRTQAEQDQDRFTVPDSVEEYLHRCFAAAFQEVEDLKATPNPYGIAYTWILRVRIVEGIFRQLHIGPATTEAHSNTFELDGTPIEIQCEHVIKWLQINKSTFETNKSHIGKFKETWTWMLANREAWTGLDNAPLFFEALEACFRMEDERLPTRHTLLPDVEPGKRYAVEASMRGFQKLCRHIKNALRT
ncbi:hypothetical protein LXA43DRAFT_1102144 [Ganoderma leucocontextum]|nr:hypothetical protein LXA43DRAFT_1102144 [Ganoderma leucocontextum]